MVPNQFLKCTAFFVIGLFIVSGKVLSAPPAHDDCSGAIPVSESIIYSGSTVDATGSSVSGCSFNDTRDVWHSFTPANSGNHTISLCGSAFDTTVSVYDACGGSQIACNDDICYIQSEAIANLTAGLTYLIRIAGYDGETGSYQLLVTERLNPPPHDEIGGAIEVYENVTHNNTTLDATGQSHSSCAQNFDFYDVWHLFVPTVTTEYSISLCGSSFDTTLSVLDDQMTELACNDDSCDSQSKVTITLNGGQLYYIRIAGYDGAAGNYTLNITRTTMAPPHDACDDAIEVFLDTPYWGSSLNATGNTVSGCSGNDKLDVWHSFTPVQSGYHTVSLCGSSFDTSLAVYTDCTGSAVQLACNDNICDVQSEAVADLIAGQTCLIRIAGRANKTGDYVLTISERFVQPVNDECADAIEVLENVPYFGDTSGALGDTGSSCGFFFDFYDVWHSFTPTETKDYRISLCGSDFDTTLSIWDSCSGLELACNDDGCGSQSQSQLAYTMTAGQTYLIRVAGYDGDQGAYMLSIMEDAPPPVHDECSGAIALTANLVHFNTTVGATGSAVSTCGTDDHLDVWHSFTAATSSLYQISLCGSSFDTTLSVYDACGGLELACNDDACGYQSELNIPLDAGQTCWIRVAGYRDAIGDYQIQVGSNCPSLSIPGNPVPGPFAYDVQRDIILSWDHGDQMQQQMQTLDLILKGIYGTDDRLDDYQVVNTSLKQIGDSTVALLPVGDVIDHGDGSYSITAESFADYYLSAFGRPLCPDEPFRDQPVSAFCSGFLVAPDMIATTGHCIVDQADCSNTAVLFGYKMLNSTTPVLTFDESDVYFCDSIVARQQTDGSDWALIRLDRPVTTHAPVPVRRTGAVAMSQDLELIGYPVGLPLKYAGNAQVQENSQPGYFQANLDAFFGNSGSPVVNRTSYEVEGLLYSGNPDFVEVGSCDQSAQCPDTGCPDWEKVTRTTEFHDLIPVYDVYFGTDSQDLQLICADSTTPWCSPGTLACGMNYYWQVITKNYCSQSAGPVWVFSTQHVGDLDHNCTVNLEDFVYLASGWMQQPCDTNDNWCQQRDLDKLGSVDLSDLVLLVSHWTEQLIP